MVSNIISQSPTLLRTMGAERINWTLLNLVWSILHIESLYKRFLAQELSTTVNVRSQVASKSIFAELTHHHLWHGSIPDLSHTREFVQNCCYTIPKVKFISSIHALMLLSWWDTHRRANDKIDGFRVQEIHFVNICKIFFRKRFSKAVSHGRTLKYSKSIKK